MEDKPENPDEKSILVSITYGTPSGALSTVASVSAIPTSAPKAAMSIDEGLIRATGETVEDKLPLIPFEVKETPSSPEPEERTSRKKSLRALKSRETDGKRKKSSVRKKFRKRERPLPKNRSSRDSALTDDDDVEETTMIKTKCFFFMAAFSILTAVIIMSFCTTFRIRWGKLRYT